MKLEVTYDLHVQHWMKGCPVISIAGKDFLTGKKEEFAAVIRMLTAMGGCTTAFDDSAYDILYDYLEKHADRKLILGIKDLGSERKLVLGTTLSGKLYPLLK